MDGKKSLLLAILSFVFTVYAPSAAQAAPITFFGQDEGLGEDTRLTSIPYSTAAQTSFFSKLASYSTENFESFANGTTAPLTLSLGADLDSTGEVVSLSSGTDGYGRYPISGNNFWKTYENFTLEFSSPQVAFGFFVVDIGDFSGQLSLTYSNSTSQTVNIPHIVDGKGGSVAYFGFIDTAHPFDTVEFNFPLTTYDAFAFDDFTTGPVRPSVPEPSTFILFGVGVAGLAFLRKRFKKN